METTVFLLKKIVSPCLGVIENGVIWVENGVIQKVSPRKKVRLSKEVEVKDFSAYSAYPGFIDAHSHITVVGEGIGAVGRDNNEASEMITPHLRIRDSINLDTQELAFARKEGILGVAVAPGSSNLIGGTLAFIKTTSQSLVVDDVIVKDPIGLKLALGENPKRVYGARQKLFTRMGALGHIREFFQEVVNYRNKKRKEKNLKYEVGVQLLNRKFPARIHAHQANDIQNAIHLGEEFGFDVVIEHCTDGDRIAEYLMEKGVGVVIGPLAYPATKIESKNRNIYTPSILSQKGVLTAITCDAPVYNIMLLRYLAGWAIKGGMEYMEALKAITLNPAKICTVQDFYGDIRVGMPAHFVIWEGDPLQDIQASVVAIIEQKKILENSSL